jgi:hypothetical protein
MHLGWIPKPVEETHPDLCLFRLSIRRQQSCSYDLSLLEPSLAKPHRDVEYRYYVYSVRSLTIASGSDRLLSSAHLGFYGFLDGTFRAEQL